MKRSVKSADKILPFGESIRGFLNQSYLTEPDMRSFLRNKGVFLSSYGKDISVPLITSTLLGPEEFDSLKESQGTREDNPKRTSEIINWDTEKSLRDVVTAHRQELLASLIPTYSNCRLISNPSVKVYPDNPNEVNLTFQVERNDLNKSWYESTNEFKAEVTLTVDPVLKKLKITKTHTSEETKGVLSNFTKNVKLSLVQHGYANVSDTLEKITFNNFDNSNRFYFLFSLATKIDNQDISITFKDIYDIEFKPDPGVTLPSDLSWMHDKSKVILVGKAIENTNFLRDTENYKFLILWNVESSYDFDIGGIKGSISLQIGFPDYPRGYNKNSELIITSSKIMFRDRLHFGKKNAVTKIILDALDQIKFETYERFGISKLAGVSNQV
jgi:3-phenylpropionate/cinnamic acid dioxygenase small subunit